MYRHRRAHAEVKSMCESGALELHPLGIKWMMSNPA